EEEIDMGAPRTGARAAPRGIGTSAGSVTPDLGENAEEEISRILTETDVYIKYGLHDKAIEHLQQVFQRDPASVPGHEKLKDLYVQSGRTDEAVQELLWLAETAREARPEDAAQYVREALDLEPANAEVNSLLVELVRLQPT